MTGHPELLVLEPGDNVSGTFVRLEAGTTKKGERRGIAILNIDGSERSLWLHEAALRGQFQKLKPEAGELVRITKGSEKKLGGSGFTYWPFEVTAPDREPETIGWDSPLLGDDEPEMPPAGFSGFHTNAEAETETLQPPGEEADDADIPF